MKGNWSGAAHDRICLISIQISIENIRKLIRGSPGLNLFDFYLILIESERKESIKDIERRKQKAIVKLGRDIDQMKAVLLADIKKLESTKNGLSVNNLKEDDQLGYGKLVNTL